MAKKTPRPFAPVKKNSSSDVNKKPMAKKKPAAKPVSNKSLEKPVHARPSANPEKRIRERLKQHPNAMVTEIVASLEMDGVSVTSDQVQEVMKKSRRSPA